MAMYNVSFYRDINKCLTTAQIFMQHGPGGLVGLAYMQIHNNEDIIQPLLLWYMQFFSQFLVALNYLIKYIFIKSWRLV